MGCLGLAGTMDGTSQQAAGSQTEPDGTATQQQFHLSLGLAPFGQPTVCNTLILFLPLPSHGTGAYRAGCYGSCKRDTHIVNVLSPLIDDKGVFQSFFSDSRPADTRNTWAGPPSLGSQTEDSPRRTRHMYTGGRVPVQHCLPGPSKMPYTTKIHIHFPCTF